MNPFISKIDLEMLKRIKKSAKNDSKYVFKLLYLLFTTDELRESSFGGAKSNFNGKQHKQLDPAKVKKMQGK